MPSKQSPMECGEVLTTGITCTRPAGHGGTHWSKALTPSDPSTPERPLEDELETAYAWIADLKQHLKNVLESATPNEKDHPTMFEAWKHGRHALSQAPNTLVVAPAAGMFTPQEEQVISELMQATELKRIAVLRQGLRIYQAIQAGITEVREINPALKKAVPAPEAGREPKCWHKEIDDEGICKTCGVKAAIKLPFTPTDFKEGRMHVSRTEPYDLLCIPNADQQVIIEQREQAWREPDMEAFIYVLNRYDNAAQADTPFEAGYPQARADVIQYVSLLKGRLSIVVEALRDMTDCPFAPTFCNCPAHEKRHAILRDFPQEPKP